VVAAAAAVAVEVGWGDAVVGEVLAGGGVLLDGAGGGDVVGGNGVAEDGESASGADVPDGCWVAVMPSKYGAFADVGGVGLPAVGVAGGELEVLQLASPSVTVAYCLRNISESMQEATVSATSCWEGQMSLRKTGWPDLSWPSGSISKLWLMWPASA